MQDCCGVILAAGDGKRMKSRHAKVLCQVLFEPMLSWVVANCHAAGITQVCTVISDCGADVQALLQQVCPQGETAVQKERLGTGHAVQMAGDFLRHGPKNVLVLCGDAPFVDADTIKAAFACHQAGGNAVTIVGGHLENPHGYGRLLTREGKLLAIVEEKDANEAQRKITLVNAGVYWFDRDFLLGALARLTPQNVQGEYYLTDTIGLAVADGLAAGVFESESPYVTMGANNREDLAKLNQIARIREIKRHYLAGVDIPFPETVVIGPKVEIGPDTLILPGCILKGNTQIGAGCTIGPDTALTHVIVGDDAILERTVAEDSTVEKGAKIGPFTRLRPGSTIGQGAKIGNFVEIKNTTVGEKSSVAHLTYLGDCDLGKEANIGCGVVTANYDGAKKYRTIIGDKTFIGCNTNLIAPVQVGAGSTIAAGTTVTEDVPADGLAVGRARQENKANWSKEKGKYKRS